MGISLTAGMRSNLYSLQSTAKMMEQTQTRLSTGKKVNSALDNPTSYFTAKSHNDRATSLASFKDGMGEAIQAINAANAGIEGISTLIESAIAVAKDAKEMSSFANGSDNATQTISLASFDLLVEGDKITIAGQAYSLTNGGDTAGHEFALGADASITAANLAMLINSNAEGDISATSITGGDITLERDVTGGMVASDVVIDAAYEDVFTESGLIKAGDTQREKLETQFDELITQLDALVNDSNYKGTNLLDTGATGDLAGNKLVVNFTDTNDTTLTGFGAKAADLGIAAKATGAWASKTDVEGYITNLETAKNTIAMEASDLASNLSTIKARQSFTEAMINTLETGADNLTLADMNEEGANMLMLQTQQSLGTTSLSMSAQSAQAVLRLF